MKKISTLLLIVATGLSLFAQPSANYYTAAKGQKGYALKTALSSIVGNPSVKSYNQLWEAYKKTDLKADGTIYDCYSNTTKYGPNDHGSNSSGEGDGFNREHSFPKSWFNNASPMSSDLFHVIPSDIWLNSKRGNHPFGEVGSSYGSSKNEYSKWGNAKSDLGYSGFVFEPNDEWKGDFARIYFYMGTAYENRIASWNSPMLSGNRNSAYKEWAIKMLLRWAAQDPVSQKEIDRNNAVEKQQGNRNPFVDFPGLEQYIWGDKKDVAFDPANYNNGNITPDPTPEPQPEPNPEPEPQPNPDAPQGENVYIAVKSISELKVGENYLIVCESKNMAMSAPSEKDNNIRTNVSISIDAASLTTETNTSGKPYTFTLGGVANAYTLYDATSNSYLGYENGSKNKLQSYASLNGNTQWTITMNSDQTIRITPNTDNTRYIQYNAGSPRFACYIENLKQFYAVKLYKPSIPTAITTLTSGQSHIDVYNLNGQVVRRRYPANDLHRLPAGFYVIRGQKILVK